MRITSIKLLKENHCGLKKIIMSGLDNIVVLVGPNGSGKTRLLKLLSNEVQSGKKDVLEYSFSDNIDEDKIQIADYSHYDLKLQLPEKFPPFVISSAANRLKACNFEKTINDALLFIQDLAESGGADFNEFNELLKEFIGETVDVSTGTPQVFGLKFSEMELSPGQQYLLRMCVALYCNETKQAPILILDEPEVHLHPRVLTDIIKKIQDKFLDTQIWIATHSISLLTMFDTTKIWYMENGCVSRMGSNSDKVINGLIGKEEDRYNLQQFVSLPEVFAFNRFAYESLINPEAIPYTKKDDPQVKSVIQSLELIQKKEKICIVDYGVGKGRLLEALSNENVFSKFDYRAYDISDEDKVKCEEVISRCTNGKAKYYNDIDLLKSELPNGADAVLMVNVLHEIDPAFWVEVLKQNITELLNDNGLLILVELEEFTYGEKPYKNGFLVPQEDGIKCLFGGTHIEPHRDAKRRELVCYRININLLQEISTETIIASLHSLKKQALLEIEAIRSNSGKKPAFSEGIKHAFWTQQFANAVLSINQMEKGK